MTAAFCFKLLDRIFQQEYYDSNHPNKKIFFTAKFHSSDGEEYILKCMRNNSCYSDSRTLTLEWNKKSNKFINICCFGASSTGSIETLPIKWEKSVYVSNAKTATITFSVTTPMEVVVFITEIPCICLANGQPSSQSSNSQTSNPAQKKIFIEKKLEKLSTDIASLLETGDLSDVVLTDGSKEIRAHKLILSARSSVFSKMLTHPMKESKENRITIKDISIEVLQELLYFIYSGIITIKDSKTARNLYIAADKYDVQELRGICSAMLKSMDMNEVLETLLLADLYSEKVLKNAALDFISKNYSQIKAQKKWSNFIKEHQNLSIEILSFVIDNKK